MKLKKKSHKKIEEKNLSRPELTQLTRLPRHEIRIKKIDFQKKDQTKKGPS
jgi:hypothetical protein